MSVLEIVATGFSLRAVVIRAVTLAGAAPGNAVRPNGPGGAVLTGFAVTVNIPTHVLCVAHLGPGVIGALPPSPELSVAGAGI